MGVERKNQLPGQTGIQFAGPDDARLVFSGPPQQLAGAIPLVNTSKEKQKLRTLTMAAGALKGAARLPIQEFPFAARLYPGQQASVPGIISLDPHTPPGSYEIELSLGGRSIPATMHVTEVVNLRIEPKEITILAGSAESYTRQLIAHNLGNTDLPLGARCEAPVFDSFDLISGLVMGLHKADQSSAVEMVKGFLSEWAGLQAGTMVITRDPIILRPGQKIVADVEFHLPSKLKPLRHYRASLQLYNANLSVDIYTTAKTGSRAGSKAQATRREKDA